jgi:uncharacterized protein (TIRG00374 family)
VTSRDASEATRATTLSRSDAWRRYVRPGLLVLVTGISLYALLPSLLAVFSSWRSLGQLTWYWAALALVAEAASFVLLWQLDRVALHERSWFVVVSAQLGGNAVGRIVPGGGAAATAFTVGMLRRAGVDVGQAVAALAAATSLQVATRLVLPVLALPAILGGTVVDRGLATSAFLGLAVLALLIAAGVLAFAFDRPLVLAGRSLQWLLNATTRRRRKIADLPRRLLAIRDFVRATIGRHWQSAVVSAAGSTAFDFAALLCALRAVGAEPRPSLVLLAYAAAGLLALIPLTPGGLGFVEAGLVGTLTLAGVGAEDALLATLTYRLVSYWLPIPVGGAAYAAFTRRYPSADRRTAEFPHAVSAVSDSRPAAPEPESSRNPKQEVIDGLASRSSRTDGTK